MRSQIYRDMDQISASITELIEATSWDSMVETIIQYPPHFLQATGTALFTFNEAEKLFELAAHWLSSEENFPGFPAVLSGDDCAGCLSEQSTAKQDIRLCPAAGNNKENEISSCYCAPLFYRGQLTALLHVVMPADHTLSGYEEETISHVLPEMALAINNARLERLLFDQAEAASEMILMERRRIAQDLHDTLAQNLGYLRLKLDQISSDGMLLESDEIQQEIEHMRDAAAEAYEQIRDTLALLDPICQIDLEEALRERAIFVGERAGFAVALELRGDPLPLSAECRRQAMYISQEALNNVEKHANARIVNIQADWGPKELTLSIFDDGIGFELDEILNNHHFGLSIMERRAQSIGGELTIDSELGSGTRIILHLPVNMPISLYPYASLVGKEQYSLK